VKTGDAKLWVYRRDNGYDCQAAEDHKRFYLCLFGLAYYKPGYFFSGVLPVPVIPVPEPFQSLFDKGKPGENRRRKATGLPPSNGHDRRAAENQQMLADLFLNGFCHQSAGRSVFIGRKP
jgi:hypothetical protein